MCKKFNVEAMKEQMNQFNYDVINLDELEIDYLRNKFICKFNGIDTIIRRDGKTSEYLFVCIGDVLYIIDKMNDYDSCAFVLNPSNNISICKTIKLPGDIDAVPGYKGEFLIRKLFLLFDEPNNSIPEITIHSRIKDIRVDNKVNAQCMYKVDEKNRLFSSFNGALYDKEQTSLIHGNNK